MRLFDENSGCGRSSRAGWVFGLGIGLAAALSGCGPGATRALPLAQVRTGPAADYPLVIGTPYSVGDTLYTPADTLNYDEVGYSTLDNEGGDAVTAAHHTLPLPSYVEVTSLTTGRTILVRLERRGPMTDNSLIALSPEAAAQLEAAEGTPVRVRRVNPPEFERAALRLGQQAPVRLETPDTLLAVLRRKLPAEGAATLAQTQPSRGAPAAAADVSSSVQVSAAPSSDALPATPTSLEPTAPSTPEVPANSLAMEGGSASTTTPGASSVTTSYRAYVVQAGAFSSEERAQRVADVIGGSVSRSGTLFRVRTGPFGSRQEAEASLAKVKAAGYRDARIFTNG